MKKHYELLKGDLPNFEDPCKKPCSGHNGSCCGCPAARDYDSDVQRFKDAGVYEEAIAIVEYRRLLEEKKRIENKMASLDAKLASMNIDITSYL